MVNYLELHIKRTKQKVAAVHVGLAVTSCIVVFYFTNCYIAIAISIIAALLVSKSIEESYRKDETLSNSLTDISIGHHYGEKSELILSN